MSVNHQSAREVVSVSWTAEDHELLVIWWNAGIPIPEMARRFKKPRDFVRARTEALPPRNPQGRRARTEREAQQKAIGDKIGGDPLDDWTEWEDLLLVRLREEGHTFAAIGDALGRVERTCCRRYANLKWRGKLVEAERRCICGNKLSRWNVSVECFACQERRAATRQALL